MNNLFYHLETLKIPRKIFPYIRKDCSQLANHFVVYSQIDYKTQNYDSIERINSLFPYPNYEDEDYIEDTLNCINLYGTAALLEIILRIDIYIRPNMDEINDYIINYISSDIPF